MSSKDYLHHIFFVLILNSSSYSIIHSSLLDINKTWILLSFILPVFNDTFSSYVKSINSYVSNISNITSSESLYSLFENELMSFSFSVPISKDKYPSLLL